MSTATRVFWESATGRTFGVITERRRNLTTVFVDVTWDNGRHGSFIQGKEPNEFRYAVPAVTT